MPEKLAFQKLQNVLANESKFEIEYLQAPHGVLSYFIIDKSTKEAVLFEPTHEAEEVYYDWLENHQEVQLKYVLDTHTHADHISIGKKMRESHSIKLVMSHNSPTPKKDLAVSENDTIIFGDNTQIKVLETSGHTNESLTFVMNDGQKDLLFTGDALLIDACGRTDFQLGNSLSQYQSMIKLADFADNSVVFPGHDYNGRVYETMANIKQNNTRMKMALSDKEGFIKFMDELHPPLPDLFDISIPANIE